MNLQLQKIKTPAELQLLLQLRQKVYRKSAVSGFLSNPDADIEVDVFDGQSEFFGLYEERDGTQQLVGGRRVVYRKPVSESKRMITALGLNTPDCPEPVLPIEQYGGQKTKRAIFHLQQKYGLNKVVEPSRMVIAEQARGLKSIVFLLKASVVVSLGVDKSQASLFCSNDKYTALYQRVGCQLISDEVVNVGGSPVITFSMEYKDMLPKVKCAFDSMHQTYMSHETIYA